MRRHMGSNLGFDSWNLRLKFLASAFSIYVSTCVFDTHINGCIQVLIFTGIPEWTYVGHGAYILHAYVEIAQF